jgi:hypothetical protein
MSVKQKVMFKSYFTNIFLTIMDFLVPMDRRLFLTMLPFLPSAACHHAILDTNIPLDSQWDKTPSRCVEDLSLCFEEYRVVKIHASNYKVRPFRQEARALGLEKKADELSDKIFSHVSEIFKPYGIDTIKESGTASRKIYFGGRAPRNRYLLGSSQGYEDIKRKPGSESIVFVHKFPLWFGEFKPSLDDYAGIMAVVAAHEVGHFFSLQHDNNPYSIMHVSDFENRQFILKEWPNVKFTTGKVAAVFPYMQDAESKIYEMMGDCTASR